MGKLKTRQKIQVSLFVLSRLYRHKMKPFCNSFRAAINTNTLTVWNQLTNNITVVISTYSLYDLDDDFSAVACIVCNRHNFVYERAQEVECHSTVLYNPFHTQTQELLPFIVEYHSGHTYSLSLIEKAKEKGNQCCLHTQYA